MFMKLFRYPRLSAVFFRLIPATVFFVNALMAQTPAANEVASSSSVDLQEQNPQLASSPQPVATVIKPRVETSVSLGVFPQLTATRMNTYDDLNIYKEVITQSFTPSAGVLGTFRQSFRPWLGYVVSLGYTRTSEHYTNADLIAGGVSSNYYIANNAYEWSLAYLAEKHVTRKLAGFVDLGAGAMIFLPVHRGASAINYAPNHYQIDVPGVNLRPLGVAGVGVDYHFNSAWGLRVEYRGQLYKYPDYGFEMTKYVTVSSEPTFSLTYRFGTGKDKKQ